MCTGGLLPRVTFRFGLGGRFGLEGFELCLDHALAALLICSDQRNADVIRDRGAQNPRKHPAKEVGIEHLVIENGNPVPVCGITGQNRFEIQP